MVTVLGFTAAVVLAGVLPDVSAAARELTVEAPVQRYDGEARLLTSSGGAVLRGEGLVMLADQVDYAIDLELATARGHVVLALSQGGSFGATGDIVRLRLEHGEVVEVFVEGGQLLKKSGVSPEALLSVRTPEALRAVGKNSLSLAGRHIKRVGEDAWEVDDLAFTPCDCDPARPSWHIGASSATLHPDAESATLTGPTVWVGNVPVFWLPWLYLPLSDRRTGFLVPRPGRTAQNGYSIEQPFFLVLGESADATFTPSYIFGRAERPDPVACAAGVSAACAQQGVEGPRLLTEVRWAPAEATRGRATLGLLYDLRPRRDPVTLEVLDAASQGGLRGEASLQHVQDLGGGWGARADMAVISDGRYVRDLSTDLLARETQYLRSTAAVFHRSDDAYQGLLVGLRQDTRWGYSLWGRDVDTAGNPRRGPNTLQELPALRLSLPERPLWGPLAAGASASFVRLAPLRHGTGDEGAAADDGRGELFCPPGVGSCVDQGQGNHLFEPGEREARDRLDVRLSVLAPWQLGRYATVTPELAYRQDLYRGELTGRTSHRGYASGGLVASTRLIGDFGSQPGDLRHLVVPRVEARWVPSTFGSEPGPYDDIDTALGGAQGGRLLQAIAEVRQQLLRREGAGWRELVRLDVGQGVDLARQVPGEAFARLIFSQTYVDGGVLARYQPASGRWPLLAAWGQVHDSRGDAVLCRYERLSPDGTDRSRRGIDALLATSALGTSTGDAELVTAGLRANLTKGLSFRYDATLARARWSDGSDPITLLQHAVALRWAPACDCWSVELDASQLPGDVARGVPGATWLGTVNVWATVTVAGFGSFGGTN